MESEFQVEVAELGLRRSLRSLDRENSLESVFGWSQWSQMLRWRLQR